MSSTAASPATPHAPTLAVGGATAAPFSAVESPSTCSVHSGFDSHGRSMSGTSATHGRSMSGNSATHGRSMSGNSATHGRSMSGTSAASPLAAPATPVTPSARASAAVPSAATPPTTPPPARRGSGHSDSGRVVLDGVVPPSTPQRTSKMGCTLRTPRVNGVAISPATAHVRHRSADVKAPPGMVVDKYGFFIPEAEARKRQRLGAKRSRLESSRLVKWQEMLSRWSWFVEHKPKKVKERIRKGIPNACRGRVWQVLSGALELKAKNPGAYQRLVARSDSSTLTRTIKRDLLRTFPTHCMFSDESSDGIKSLLNLLLAYSVYDTDVGYCQGMGFLACVLLNYMPEEDAFWMFVCMLTTYGFGGMFQPGLPRFQLLTFQFDMLLKRFYPKLKKHLEAEGVASSMYSSQWFITMFSYAFPFELVMRVWDIFLSEGWKIILRVALAIMKLGYKQLLKSGFEEIVPFLQQLTSKIDTDLVVRTALGIRITTKQLAALEEDFHQAEDAAVAALEAMSALEMATTRPRSSSAMSGVTGDNSWAGSEPGTGAGAGAGVGAAAGSNSVSTSRNSVLLMSRSRADSSVYTPAHTRGASTASARGSLLHISDDEDEGGIDDVGAGGGRDCSRDSGRGSRDSSRDSGRDSGRDSSRGSSPAVMESKASHRAVDLGDSVGEDLSATGSGGGRRAPSGGGDTMDLGLALANLSRRAAGGSTPSSPASLQPQLRPSMDHSDGSGKLVLPLSPTASSITASSASASGSDGAPPAALPLVALALGSPASRP